MSGGDLFRIGFQKGGLADCFLGEHLVWTTMSVAILCLCTFGLGVVVGAMLVQRGR